MDRAVLWIAVLCLPICWIGCVRTERRMSATVGVFAIEGRLVHKSNVSASREDIAPYASFRGLCQYSGSNGMFAVEQWAIVNGVVSDSYTALEIGKTYQLLVVRRSDLLKLRQYSRQRGCWPIDGYMCISDHELYGQPSGEIFVEFVCLPNISLEPRSTNQVLDAKGVGGETLAEIIRARRERQKENGGHGPLNPKEAIIP